MFFFQLQFPFINPKKNYKKSKTNSGVAHMTEVRVNTLNIYTYFHSHLVEVQLPVNRLTHETGTFYYNMSFIAYL